MMIRFFSAVLLLAAGSQLVKAQQNPTAEELQKQVLELQRAFEKQQAEHQRQIQRLQEQINLLQQRDPVPALPPPPEPGVSPTTPPSLQTPPTRLNRGASYLDVGIIGTFAVGSSTASEVSELQLGGHDPNQRGFTVQGVEAIFAGAVDPYFRGNANILFGLDAGGESFIELEEAWLETYSLPANLQLRAGQLMTEFGRHNTLHPHSWAFVDAPLVHARLLGPDGLRNPGARVSWLTPTPFFSEVFLTVQNSHGETAAPFRGGGGHLHGHEEEEEIPFAFRHAENDRGLRSPGDLLFTPRYAASFDLTDNQVLLLGASAAFGPNDSGEEGQDTETQLYGLDFTWKWKSPNHSAGYPFVMLQNELRLRRFEAGAFDWDENGDGLLDEDELDLNGDGIPDVLPAEKLVDFGFYSQLLYGFRKGWVAGFRVDYVDSRTESYESEFGRDPLRAERWRLSPNLTWYPTEFSKLRLQYNYDDRESFGSDHSVWFQFEYILGAHGAHKF